MGTNSSSSLGSPSEASLSEETPTSVHSSPALSAARHDLEKLLGPEHVRPATPSDFVDGIPSHLVVEPETPEKVAATLKFARDAGLHVIPRGNGTKKNWGNPPRAAEIILSVRRLNRIVEHAWGDMTATVEAGCTFATFQQALAEHGQRLALDPLWPEHATIGGILATNDSGPLRLRFGSLRDLIIGITLALPDGTLAKSGGKVVKNVAGYDLPKLATGSLGTLGVITQAIFRLHPLPRETSTISISLPDIANLSKLLHAIHDCTTVPTGVQIRAASNSALEFDLRFEGTAAGCDAQIDQIRNLVGTYNATRTQSSDTAWHAITNLWNTDMPSTICKFSTLPSEIESFLRLLTELSAPHQFAWRVVAQSVGVGYLRLESPNHDGIVKTIGALRGQLEPRGGSLVILRCPPQIKSTLAVWGTTTDSLPLMRSIKQQFDPTGVLNPGRFVGSI